MSELELIKVLAEQALTVITPAGTSDNFLWDRAQRIAGNVEQICRLPELASADLRIDRFCLISAAYFIDAGLAKRSTTRSRTPVITPAEANAAELRDISTQVVTEKLTRAVPAARIDKINKIIIESGNRLTRMTEAMILADACSLDDIGAVGIFSELRRCAILGKGAADAVRSWKRKLDYRYWDARLEEGFRFESVRKIAAERFRVMESFMSQLTIETIGQDLEEIILEALKSS